MSNQNDSNPYLCSSVPPLQPNSCQSRNSVRFVRGNRKGPALYIVSIGMLFGFGAVPLLMRYNPIGLAVPLVGCVLGGIVYRIRSRHWPIDPSARTRQCVYVLCVLTLVPATIYSITGIRAQGAGMVAIGAIVGFSVALGILLSGLRRHGSLHSTESEAD